MFTLLLFLVKTNTFKQSVCSVEVLYLMAVNREGVHGWGDGRGVVDVSPHFLEGALQEVPTTVSKL